MGLIRARKEDEARGLTDEIAASLASQRADVFGPEPEPERERAREDRRKSRRRFGRGDEEPELEPEPEPEVPHLVAVPPPGPDLTSSHRRIRLGDLLIRKGLLGEDQLLTALSEQKSTGKKLGALLVELGMIDERQLSVILAEQFEMETVDLRYMTVDKVIASLLPEDLARELTAIPIARERGRVVVAVGDPLEAQLAPRLSEALGSPVLLKLAAISDVRRVIAATYTSTARVDDAVRVFEARVEARRAAQQDDGAANTVDENAPIVKVVNLILEQSVRDRASDVHIEPQEDQVRIRVRTDGALHPIMTLPGSMALPLMSRIKVLADMNIVERRRPQDGQMQVKIAGKEMDVRVSTTPVVWGEKCVLRILDKSKALYKVSDLGMPVDTAVRYTKLIRSPYGMVICAGPTGSGKTTTLYATLTEINSDDVNIMTIEDPVEYTFPTINQIGINEAAGVTFASGLRSILRQDPDAVLVGEIRDLETARIAVQAALTGHFVMSSLHATDSVSALYRFMDMGVEPFLVSSALLGVVGQRLMRRVCRHCATAYEPTEDELTFYRSSGGDPNKRVFVRGAGCNFCGHTGYFERTGVYEVLEIGEELKRLIVEGAPHEVVRQAAIDGGMRTLRDQAIQLVTSDQTTVAEVLRTVYVL